MAMAIISLVIRGTTTDTSIVSVFVSVDPGDTVESLTADYALVLWDVIRPIITGVLVDVNITIKPDFSGWTNNTPTLFADVQEKADFRLRTCANDRLVRLSLPTISETIFENSGRGKLVDATNADVQAFYYVMSSALVDGGINATDSHGIDICSVISGEQLFTRRT